MEDHQAYLWEPLARLPTSQEDFDVVRQGLDASKGERSVHSSKTIVEVPKSNKGKELVVAASTDAGQQVQEVVVATSTEAGGHIEEFDDVSDRGNVGEGSGKSALATDEVLETGNTDQLPPVSEDVSRQLASIGDVIKERKKQMKINQTNDRKLLAPTLLDVSDGNLLGLTLADYRKVKEDPRIINALKEALDIELDKHYRDDEAEHDARCLNISVEKVKQVRTEGILKRTEKVKKVVNQVLHPPKSKGRSKPKPLSRDANLRTWVETNEPTTEDIKAAIHELSTSQIKLANESEARNFLSEVQQRRHNPGRITDVQVSIKPGRKHFVVVVQYFGGPRLTTENPGVHRMLSRLRC